MKDNIIAGINEKNLLELCIMITKYADSVTEIFNKFDDDMDELKNYYDSTSFSLLLNSYESFSKNFSVIRQNILTYSNDLTELVNKMRNGMLDIARLYSTFSEKYVSKRKAIEMNGGIK